MQLPDRDRGSEDQFVTSWSDRCDAEGLLEVVAVAWQAKRPLLAARLVQLLPDHIEIEPGSPAERAVAAATWLLHQRPPPEDRSWAELDDLLQQTRRDRFQKARRRQRDAMAGGSSDMLGLTGAGRRRRR